MENLSFCNLINDVEFDRKFPDIIVMIDDDLELYLTVKVNGYRGLNYLDLALDWIKDNLTVIQDRLLISKINSLSDAMLKVTSNDISSIVKGGLFGYTEEIVLNMLERIKNDNHLNMFSELAINGYLEFKEDIYAANQKEAFWKNTVNRGRFFSQRDIRTSGYNYVIKADLPGNFFYKIGKANSIKSRLAIFETTLPFDWELIHYIETDKPYLSEKKLHNIFSHARGKGEWFSLVKDDLKQLLNIRSHVNDCFIYF